MIGFGESIRRIQIATDIRLRVFKCGKFLYVRPDGIGLSTIANLIGLLPNPHEPRRDNVTPLGPTSVGQLPVFELRTTAVKRLL
jgi:hypothetical protein